ncbi:MAG: ImmA/IrrE family metallo-endopeptidase [Lachnospiraceae bacterium]|nr:ImmA/IrrE family metallo-endopeptidase [Lachnospiraceae bacterium]
MQKDDIYERVEHLVRKYKTRNPLELLECMKAVVMETDRYERLKGYCFLSCQTYYVMISSFLPEPEKKIVAAHELGHIVLHKQELKMAPMKDSVLDDMTSRTEYEANLFAADTLIRDNEVEILSKDPDLNYFSMCSSLDVSPELMSFKLYSLVRRGYSYNMPMEIDSRFLAK